MSAGDETQTSDSAGFPAPALLPGDPRRIGGVRLLGRLGEGGMGTVYLGQTAAGRRVAVKMIRSEYARDERYRTRFRAEARAAQTVARFCTAQVLDVGVDGDLAYLVTEFIDGPNLSAAINAEGPLSGSLLDSLAIGVAAALNGIHAAGVVHRDLKPANVLLSRVGPKVIDFGIARAPDSPASITESGQVVGTPAYMAPEQFHGAATAATDIHSWGAVIAYAGTGRPPFGTGTPYELMRRVTEDEPDLGGLEQPLRGLVAAALDKRPERRPTARALLLALVGDEEDPARVLSRRWTPAAATLIDLPPTRLDRPDATPGATPAAALRRNPRRVIVLAAGVAAVVAAAAFLPGLIGDHQGNPDARSTGHPTAAASVASQEPSGQQPSASPQPSPVSSAEAEPGAPPTVDVGVRVPANGFRALAANATDRFRFTLDGPRKISIKVSTEDCAHLIPVTLTAADGDPYAENRPISCGLAGPYALPAGRYELAFGGPASSGGPYAFQLLAG